jgi:flagellar L-ring protein precursor FlgH
MKIGLVYLIGALAILGAAPRVRPPAEEPPIERLRQRVRQTTIESGAAPGSLYVASGRFGDMAGDFRASQVNDVITIVVSDQASAVSRGATTSSRKSEVNGTVGSLLGVVGPRSPLSQLVTSSGGRKLDGQGETSRQTTISTTLSAVVVEVLPNGAMIIEGAKDIWVNSERQTVRLRGVARWQDIGPQNRIASDRLADLEVRVEGKGVVGDAIHRPNLIYRILLGLLPY